MTEISLAQFLKANAHVESVRQAMLEALEVPRSRWSPWHFLFIYTALDIVSWNLTHPITCGAGCAFEEVAHELPDQIQPGYYVWRDPNEDPLPAGLYDQKVSP